MDIPLNEVDHIAKLVPFVSGRATTMEDALAVPAFKEVYDSTPHLHELIDIAARMEGTVRNAGTHAAGVVISDKPILEYLPCIVQPPARKRRPSRRSHSSRWVSSIRWAC